MLNKKKPFYGWYVVAACFIIGVLGIGARYSFGVFLKPLELEFGMSRSASSSLFSIYMLLCCLIAAVGGWALDRFGPKTVGLLMASLTGLGFFITSQVNASWQLLISYSVLLALGTGTIYTVANSTASRWFVKKRGLVVGITSSGGGMGVVIIAPLAALLITIFNWRSAFIIMGAIIGLGMAAASLWLIKDPRAIGLLPDGGHSQSDDGQSNPSGLSAESVQTGFSLRQAFRQKAFWFLLLTWLTVSLALHMIFVHVVPYAMDMGINALDAAFIISLMGLANIPGRLVVGKFSDQIGRNALGTACIFCQFLALLWLMHAHTLWMLYMFALVFGLCWGGAGTITTVLIGDIFGVRNLGSIMGIMSAAWAVGAALGPGIAGIIFDITGRYMAAFSVAALTLFTAVFFIYFSKGASSDKQTL